MASVFMLRGGDFDLSISNRLDRANTRMPVNGSRRAWNGLGSVWRKSHRQLDLAAVAIVAIVGFERVRIG